MYNAPHPDEETARLLAEFATREQLEERAKALGVKFRPNVSDDTLRARIAEKEAAPVALVVPEAAQAAPVAPVVPEAAQAAPVISNPGKSVMRIGSIVMAPGGTHPLTEREQADDRLMAKVNHMIKLKVIHRGTD